MTLVLLVVVVVVVVVVRSSRHRVVVFSEERGGGASSLTAHKAPGARERGLTPSLMCVLFFFLFFFFLSLLSFRAFFFLSLFFFLVLRFGDFLYCKKNVKILCVSFLFCVFVLGGLSTKVLIKEYTTTRRKSSNPHKKTPSRVRHHHRARGHKDVL